MELLNLPNPEFVKEILPKTQSDLQELIQKSLNYINSSPEALQINTKQTEVKEYRQHVQNHEIRANLKSTLGISLVLLGALIHIKLTYGNKNKILPKTLEESKYTMRNFLEQWNLYDNDL